MEKEVLIDCLSSHSNTLFFSYRDVLGAVTQLTYTARYKNILLFQYLTIVDVSLAVVPHHSCFTIVVVSLS